MITGFLILAVIAFVAVLSHRRPRFEERVIKNIPFVDWFYLLIVPFCSYFGLYLVIRNILARPKIDLLDLDQFTILTIGLFFLFYAFVGMSMHFVAKVLFRYLPQKKHLLFYQVNELFHGKLSHYMIYVSSLLFLFILALLEINYPLPTKERFQMTLLIIGSGILFGATSSKGIFYTNEWFGGYNKPLFFLVGAVFVSLSIVFRMFGLHIAFYPVNTFLFAVFASFLATFVIRQLFIFTKLHSKRRFRFLAKLLHAS